MISSINNARINNKVYFGKKSEEKELPNEDELLKNNIYNRFRISEDKIMKAFTEYPAHGIKGNINADFYEFLTMGIVPYIIGSATLMAVFNTYSKFAHEQRAVASKIGKKMALGVIFYGLFKNISKSFVNLPVKWKTGIDTQLPYRHVYDRLPEYEGDSDLRSYEYRKVGESVEFTRWDLLYGKSGDAENLNKIFDKIAKKNGLGENLLDSDQAVKPMYREVLVKSSLARIFSSYLWAAVGVGMAIQKPWDAYLKGATLKFWTPEFLKSIKTFGNSFIKSAKELWEPTRSITKMDKYSGKALICGAAAVTILSVLNTLHIKNKPSKVKESDIIDKNKESVVC